MHRALAALALVAVTAGCPKEGADAPSPMLVGEVKQALAEREKRLVSYHLVVDSTQGDETAHHEFFYRSPNRSRGVATGSNLAVAVAFDGKRLYRLDDAEKKLEVIDLELPAAKAALLLASLFRPFAPDGFRTPLLPTKGVTAKQTAHPQGPQAVELTVMAQDEDGGPLEVTYVLRWPSADFLARRTRSGMHQSEVKVDRERCDEKLRLCVPTQLTETRDGELLGTTTVTTAELNPELPADTFTLALPEGYERLARVMREP
jgi:outer membrane lipoprotein-sorting protein